MHPHNSNFFSNREDMKLREAKQGDLNLLIAKYELIPIS